MAAPLATSTYKAKLDTPDDPRSYPAVYAMRVEGNCMSPLVDDGQAVQADRDAVPKAGELAIIFLVPGKTFGPYTRIIKRMVTGVIPGMTFPTKKMKGDVSALIIVEQLDPPKQFRIPCEDILALHRVDGVIAEDQLSKAEKSV